MLKFLYLNLQIVYSCYYIMFAYFFCKLMYNIIVFVLFCLFKNKSKQI